MTGEELRKRRERLGLTQAQLGLAISRPQKTVSRWETGEARIEKPDILRFLLDCLDRDQTGFQGSREAWIEALPTFLTRDRPG